MQTDLCLLHVAEESVAENGSEVKREPGQLRVERDA